MKIELSQIYNNNPYYTIHQNGSIFHAFGYENVKKFVEEAKSKGEEIEVGGMEKLLEEHNKLLKFIGGKNEKNN